MICDCGEPCFSFTKLSTEGRSVHYRCGSTLNEKKKKICTFKESEFVGKVEFVYKPKQVVTDYPKYVPNYRNDLEKYIKLYKLSNEKNLKTGNIVANINYLLNILKYKLFFEESESIENLENRIKKAPDNVRVKQKELFPIVFVEVPEYLKVNNKCEKSVNKKKRKKTILIDPVKEEEKEKNSDSEDGEESEESDASSEVSGGFDIDEIDSDYDSGGDNYDGNFSD